MTTRGIAASVFDSGEALRARVPAPFRRDVGPPGLPEEDDDTGSGAFGTDEPAELEQGIEADGGPELPPGVGRFLRRGLILYPLAGGGLWAFTPLGFLDAFFLAGLLELLPVLAVAQVPLAAGEAIDRSSAYVGSAVAIVVLGALGLLLGLRSVGVGPMGLELPGTTDLVLWTGAGLLGGVALVLLSLGAEKLLGLDESEFVRQIIPRTGREKTLFVGVSLAAGFGEELAYRAYAIPVLAGLVGSEWTAAVLTSGIFGFLHAYQGQLGVVRTALMGLVLAGVFLWSGSIWPAILAHAVIDLFGGLVLGPRLLDEA